MKFLAFAASHRPASFNRKLIAIAAKHITAKGHPVDSAPYGDFDMPVYNDTVADRAKLPEHAFMLAKRAKEADGIIIALPEYNWSYPGSLKNIIDWTSCITANPLAGKTVLLASASPSNRGGILGLDHIKSPLEAIGLYIYPKVFALGDCTNAFDKENNLIDSRQSALLSGIIDDYVTFTGKLSNH